MHEQKMNGTPQHHSFWTVTGPRYAWIRAAVLLVMLALVPGLAHSQNGYTTPADTDGNSVYDFQEVTTLAITCPANISLAQQAGTCEANVVVPAPTVTGYCGSYTLTNDHNGTADASGTYPVGTTTVTWTVDDGRGPTPTCSMTVTVTDTTDPVIVDCPTNISVNAGASCDAVATWTAPTVSDNCSGATIAQTAGPASGSTFPLGTTTITYTATDGAGNTATCSFTVTVVDATNPTIVGCPSNISVNAGASCDAIASWTAPTVSDNCSGATIAQTAGPASGSTFPLGTTTITYTATDGAGNTATCSFTVTVVDATNPTIVGCPSNISVNAGASCNAVASWTAPTVSDNCSGATIAQTAGPASGSTFPLGTTTITYTATDGAGNTATCSFTVTVVDATDPVIVGCPSNISVNAGASCNAVATWTAPTVSDNCSGASIAQTAGPASGSTFPLGTTTITYTATDGAGNTATCSFTVTVVDATNPTIVGCPSNISVNAGASCNAVATWTAPTVSDNCSGATIAQTAGPASGSTFPLGTTTITYTATDGAGNTATCSFTVTVVDATDPVIVGCPSNISVNAGASCNAVASWTAPTVSDNCSGASIAQTAGPASGSTFPLGTTTITYTATDGAGNTATCSFTVTVVDATNPTIVGCPSNISVNAGASCNAVATWTAPTVSDNCSGASIAQTAGPASGSTFPLGTTTITYTATDGAGNTATCSFTVTVVDATNPTIVGCPSNISVNAGASCNAVATWTAPTVSDNCSGATIAQTAGPASGSTFPLGTTTITYTATDGAGNTATCSFTVTVVDATNPTIVGCPSNISVNAGASCNAVATWTAPTVSDNCSGASIAQTAGPASGSTFPLGTTTITYTATDGAGNTATCSFTVTVVDATDPVIVACPSNITVNAGASCNAVATWAAPTVSDNCSGASIAQTAGPASGSTFPLGTTTITYTATDGAGNTATCSFTVTVVDATNPTIVGCPTNISVNAGASCNAVATWTAPTVSDNCSGASIAQTAGPASGSTFPLGTTTITYTATDGAGNTATCSFTVTVVDATDPTIVGCPSNISVNAGASCSAVATWTAPTVSDNCSGATIAQTAGPASGSTFPLGTTTITYTATDGAGNTATCSFTVTVVDATNPVIVACPSNITVNAGASCNAVATWTAPTVSDNCSGATIAQTAGPASGSTFPLGTTTITYTATDGAGNTATCSFTVTVVDATNPTIVGCPSNISVNAGASCNAVATWTAPTVSDNCSGASIAQTAGPASGSTFPLGTTTITYTATDGAGNTATCSFTVTVLDATPPAIVCPADIIVGNDPGSCDAVVNYTAPVGTDNCSGATTTMTAGLASGSTFPLGTTLLTYQVTDAQGLTSSCSFTVTVNDTEDPIAVCQTITISLDGFGTATIAPADVDGGSTDNCGIVSSSVSPNTFNAVGTYSVTLTVTDAAGNTDDCTVDITVVDNDPPTAVCQDLTIYLDGTGNAVINSADLDGGSFDNGTIQQYLASDTTFTCADIGPNPVTLTVTDDGGNTASCTATVTVVDTIAPVALCQNITVLLDMNGNATITAADIDGGSTDACGIASLSVDITSFTCNDLGANTVTLSVTDNNGNSSSCTATVTVKDGVLPVALCQNITVQLNASGTATISANQIDNGSTDNCSIVSMSLDVNSFDCSDLGPNTVFLTVMDQDGNSATCQATVTVVDNSAPTITCPANVTATTNTGCTATGVALGTPVITDNCSGAVITNNAPAAYPLGMTTVTWTVTDAGGNTASCTQTVTVTDNVPPVALCQNTTVYLNASGVANITAGSINGGSTDNCGIASITASQTQFNCGHIGANTVTLTVVDNSGNTSTCTAVVTVLDTIAPNAVCQNITVALNGSGTATITAQQVNGGSSDNCGSGTLSYAINTNTFNSVGTFTVTLTVTDASGNSSDCNATVTVVDNIPPVALCQNTTVYLNSSGVASITASDINAGSYDNDTLVSIMASQTNFNCGNIGNNNVFLIVTDDYGNTAICSATVTVLDTIAPTVICQNITVSLNSNGTATITGAMIAGSTTDNCGQGGLVYTLSQSTFNAAGTYTVNLTVTDANGNSSDCSATVTVNDVSPPTAVCQNVTIYLNASGNASIVPSDIDGGSFDNGVITSIQASQTNFNCGNLGANNVTLIVTDNGGNSGFCTAVVTVLDTIAPVAVCQNLTIAMDGSGTVTISGFQMNGGSTDNCGGNNLTYSLSNNTFTSTGTYTVTLTVTDASGNTSECQGQVTITDDIDPNAICQNITVYLDGAGNVSITPQDIDGGSFDNVQIDTLMASQTTFNCANMGANNVTLTVVDESGNTASCTAVVTVLDTIAPNVVCQDILLQLNNNGQAVITAIQLNGGTTDNCGNSNLTYSISQNTFNSVGTYTVTLTVTDASGNVSTCDATVTVVDVNPPTAICQDTTIYLDANGNASITPADIDGGSFDNIGITSMTASQTVFDCDDLGANAVTLFVTDDQGNVSSCTALVTVLDTIAPQAICEQITIYIDDSEVAILTGIQVAGNSVDNCGSSDLTYTVDMTTFFEEGVYTVTVTVTDASGNTSDCTTDIIVEYPQKPLVIPAGFSPNGDGIADTWHIDGIELYPNNTVSIFNRWGGELYGAAPYQNEWSGQVTRNGFLGDQVPAGTYFYILDLGNGDTRTGYIQLNR